MPMESKTKLYYKIGEVCEITGIQPHVLRYWESEFPVLKPVKNTAGQRVYRQRDIELIGRIKKLLYEEGFTISGAKKQIRHLGGAVPKEPKPAAAPEPRPRVDRDLLARIRAELEGILATLERWPV